MSNLEDDDEEWYPPEREEDIDVEDAWGEQVANLEFFPEDNGIEVMPDWDIILDPDANLPVLPPNQFAEIQGIMEDARADQEVGAIGIDPDLFNEDVPNEQEFIAGFNNAADWIEDNAADFDGWNGWVEDLGIPPAPPAPEPRRVSRNRGPPFSRATGPMRGPNPRRPGWRFPRKPYGSHRRTLPLVAITAEEERNLVTETPRWLLVKAVLDWAKDNGLRFRPSITREHKGRILKTINEYQIPVPRMVGQGYYGDGKPEYREGEDIDFERLKWGSFTKQAQRAGFGKDRLGEFARKVLSNPNDYYPTTKRRAHFYINVLEPEVRTLQGQGEQKICPKTGKWGCVCLTKDAFEKEHKKIVSLLTDTANRLQNEAREQKAELDKEMGAKKGGRLGAVGDPSLVESKRENPEVAEIMTDPMDDKDIHYYYPNAPIMKYSELSRYGSIEQLLPKNKSFVFLLYQHSYNNGHWVLISRYAPNVFEFFCSYGSSIDEPLKWTAPAERIKLGENVPYLSKMLANWKGKVAVNKIQFQQKGNSVATCGAYCVMRTACLRNDNMDLKDFQTYLEDLKRETNVSYDEVVANFVSRR